MNFWWSATHPVRTGQRARRALRRLKTRIRRGRGGDDYRWMTWLVGPYTGTRELSRVFYINLDTSPERREDMERMLSRFDVPFERFRAVHGATEGDSYREYLAERPPMPPSASPAGGTGPYRVTDGMLGCWLSHVQLIEHISSLEHGLYLVLEDDYHLPADWRARLDTLLEEIHDDWDILKLVSGSLHEKPRLRGTGVTKHLVRLGPALMTQQNLSSAAYIIRHRGTRTQEIKRVLESAPIMHFDDALNVAMDEVCFYAPRKQFGSLTPLSLDTTR